MSKPERKGTCAVCSRKTEKLTVLRDTSSDPSGEGLGTELCSHPAWRTLPHSSSPTPTDPPHQAWKLPALPKGQPTRTGQTSLASSPEALVQLFHHPTKEPPPPACPPCDEVPGSLQPASAMKPGLHHFLPAVTGLGSSGGSVLGPEPKASSMLSACFIWRPTQGPSTESSTNAVRYRV